MKKLSLILSSILALQVLLVVALFTFKTDSGAFQSNKTFLELSESSFDAISIEQKDKPSLVLKKDMDDWRLPSYFNAPIETTKIDGFIRRLVALKTSWPIANTDDAAERFQVSKDKFERRIVFQNNGNPIKTLYLGSSPGFKKIHARVDGQNYIQAIDFSAFEASVTPEDWMRLDLIKIDLDQLTQVKGKDFSLVKTDKDWKLDGLPANQTSNTIEIKAFLDKLASLSYTGILGAQDKSEYHLNSPELAISLKKQNEEIVYQFGKLEGKDEYVLKQSIQPYYFKIAKVQVDALKEVNTKKLAQELSPENAKPEQNKQGTDVPNEPKK